MVEEIIVRKNIYTGQEHKLVYTGTGNAWKFVPAEEWMPTYLTYDIDGVTIISIDSDGFGYPMTIGEIYDNKIVKAFTYIDDHLVVILDDYIIENPES